MEQIDYKKDLAIDPHALDEEWAMHSQKCQDYVQYSADARKAYQKAEERFKVVIADCKEEIERVKAEIDFHIRQNPEMYGLAKVTEAMISSAILRSEKYQKAVQEANRKRQAASDELIETEYNWNLVKGALDNFAFQRKAALENEVGLWQKGYFATPNLPHDLPEGKRITEGRKDEAGVRQREALNRGNVGEDDKLIEAEVAPGLGRRRRRSE